jgi:hypothetical protein
MTDFGWESGIVAWTRLYARQGGEEQDFVNRALWLSFGDLIVCLRLTPTKSQTRVRL